MKRRKLTFVIFFVLMLIVSSASTALAATSLEGKPDTFYFLIGEAASNTGESAFFVQKIVEKDGYKFVKIESKDYFVTNSSKTKAIIAIQPDKNMLADIHASVHAGKNAIVVLDNDAYLNSPSILDEIYKLFGIKIAKTPININEGFVVNGTTICQIIGAWIKLSGKLNTQIIIDVLHKGEIVSFGGVHFYESNNTLMGGNPYTFFSNNEDPVLDVSASVSIGEGKCLFLAGGGLFSIFSDRYVKEITGKEGEKEAITTGENYIAIENLCKWLIDGTDESIVFNNIGLFGFIGVIFVGPIGICLGERDEKRRRGSL